MRLLEAHMASLRHCYEDWVDSEPEEIESDRPTDAEMEAFEIAEKRHANQVRKSRPNFFSFIAITPHPNVLLMCTCLYTCSSML